MSAAAVNQAAEMRADLEKKRNGEKHANSLLKDIVTMRWLVYPASAAKIAVSFDCTFATKKKILATTRLGDKRGSELAAGIWTDRFRLVRSRSCC